MSHDDLSIKELARNAFQEGFEFGILTIIFGEVFVAMIVSILYLASH